MSEELKPQLAPRVEKYVVENGPMTVEMRTERKGLSQLGGGFARFDKGGATAPWKLPYEEILCVVTGTLRLTFGDEVVEARPGDVVTIPRGAEVIYEGEAGTSAFYALTPADWYREFPNGL
ncbi:cupin domain-containing protein [Streptomyces sp. NPDC015661]|uniref:cupin domain-containing protein n=1 Tax=Streptomyces sp. NPDC015661 TaxID=3364961 RepID=UPI003702E898